MAKIAWLCIFVPLLIIPTVECSGLVELALTSYVNPRGQILSGGCCDNFISQKTLCNATACDPVFFICVSNIIAKSRCDYLNISTVVYPDTDIITDFKMTPYGFNITRWEGAVYLNISVYDKADGGKLDYMAHFERTFTLGSPSEHNVVDWLQVAFAHSDGLQLGLKIRVECDEIYKDRYCSCADINTSQEHTTCNKDGVTRKCLQGWAQLPKCLVSTTPCTNNNPCQNGANCGEFQVGNSYETVCYCLSDYTGTNCETLITTTTTSTTPTTTITTTTTTTAAPVTTTTAAAPVTTTSSKTIYTTTGKPASSMSSSMSHSTQSSSPAITKANSAASTTTVITTAGQGGNQGSKQGSPSSDGGSNIGAIVGGAVVGILAVVSAAASVIFMYSKRKLCFKSKVAPENDNIDEQDEENPEGKANETPMDRIPTPDNVQQVNVAPATASQP